MDAQQIKGLGRELKRYLNRFADCFARREPREHLRTYVQGQLSDLPRKSIEPMALAARVTPRTLQNFVAQLLWDEQRLRDRLQWLVAEEHAHPQAIGIVDESGNPKKGRHTAGVQRQWCGNTGKRDNCVVGVHLGYVAGPFQCLLDSDLYLPQGWVEDPVRRQEWGFQRTWSFAPSRRLPWTDPSGVGQRDSGGGLDVRRVLWPGSGVPGRPAAVGPELRGRDSL